jgi:hypothetical protein
MKKLVVLLMLSAFASSAFAVVDPDTNSLGIYFDTNADTYERALGFTQAYLIVTNPAFDAIKGLECKVDWDEAAANYYGMILPAGALNVGDQHNVIIGLGAAMPTTAATVMGTYTLMALAPTYFIVGALDQPSIPGVLPVVVDGDDNMFQIGLSAGVGNVCAMIGDTGVVDSESETWGGVKSLYR